MIEILIDSPYNEMRLEIENSHYYRIRREK